MGTLPDDGFGKSSVAVEEGAARTHTAASTRERQKITDTACILVSCCTVVVTDQFTDQLFIYTLHLSHCDPQLVGDSLDFPLDLSCRLTGYNACFPCVTALQNTVFNFCICSLNKILLRFYCC